MFIMTSYFAMKYNSFDIVVNFISLQIFLFLIHIYITHLNVKNIIPV